jgi:hypothetical protein
MTKLRKKILKYQARAFRKHGVSQSDFYRLKPREFEDLENEYAEEWKLENDVEDRRIARIVAAIYNNHPYKKKSVKYTEDDFLPKKRTAGTTSQSGNNLLAKAKWITALIEVKAENGS